MEDELQSRLERVKSYIELISRKQDHGDLLEAAAKPHGGGLESTAGPHNENVQKGLELLLNRREVSANQLLGMEALIIPKLRPAVDIMDGKFQVSHHLWTHLNTDSVIRERLEAAIPSIGRIELPGNRQFPYGGTGFVVGRKLVMTNRHVAAIFARGLGIRAVEFRPAHKAGIDFLREKARPTGPTLAMRRIVMIHPYWDMAILEVEDFPADLTPLKLSLADISDMDGHEIAVVGFPAFDPRNDAAEQDELFNKEYGIKRLQPGQLHGRASTESFGKVVSAAAHDCSTLGGNSGSAIIDLATGEVLALHFGGLYQERNYAVPTFELARDGRVVDTGINFAGQPNGGMPAWSDWWSKADLVEFADDEFENRDVDVSSTTSSGNTAPSPMRQASKEVTFEIPLHITVRLGAAGPATLQQLRCTEYPDGEGIIEAMVEPFRDADYSSRRGYDENFLGIEAPMPKPANPEILAKTREGKNLLHYQNFSIAMHAARRLALVVASNVTADPHLKKPDPGKKYTRKALSGLGENDQERWFIDPRLEEKFQLPDVFFTRDRGAFDKGHIIRREDVAWGATYKDLRRANGDSYHVTNCSPQTAEFNRSASGEENWGDLENHVLSSAATEKLVQFAGPVLDKDDEVFLGAGGGRNKIRAKIPSRFWKVIVAKTADGLAAFGFALEQDLSGVEFEYAPAGAFVPYMYKLADIEAMTGLQFADSICEADQYDTVRGTEVSVRSGARRKRLKN